MKIEVRIRIEVDDMVCEATVVDPHGNTTLVTGETVDELVEKLGVELLDTHSACQLAEEENNATT